MEIKTQFNVGDLTKHKYEVGTKERQAALLILEIVTQTCCAGTQNFYKCRPLMAQKSYPNKFLNSEEFEWAIGYAVIDADSTNPLGIKTFREDELVDLPEETRVIIKSQL